MANVAEKIDLLKSHVGAFTRKDGAVVAAHDTKVQKHAELPPAVHAAVTAMSPHGAHEWDHSGGSSKITVGRHRALDSTEVLHDHGFRMTGGDDDEMKHPDGHTATIKGSTLEIKHGGK